VAKYIVVPIEVDLSVRCVRYSVVDTETEARVSAVANCPNQRCADLICNALNAAATTETAKANAPYQSARISFLIAALRDLGVSDVDEKTPVNELYRRLGDALSARVHRVVGPVDTAAHPVEVLREYAEHVAAATGLLLDYESFDSAKSALDAVTINGMALGPETDAHAAAVLEGFAQRLRSGAQHVASGFMNHNYITLEFKFD